jgi:hypothetical protein
MVQLLGGIVILAAACALFLYVLPRQGKSPRFVGTEWEAYVAVAFCGGFVLGCAMILAAMLETIAAR